MAMLTKIAFQMLSSLLLEYLIMQNELILNNYIIIESNFSVFNFYCICLGQIILIDVLNRKDHVTWLHAH